MRLSAAVVVSFLCWSSVAAAEGSECDKYVEQFNQQPDAANADEILYNAGVCYEEHHSLGAAIQMFELLSANYPKSKVTPSAIYGLGRMYAQITWFREAAEKLEEYAKKYANEADAGQALRDAIYYRRGLGDDEGAIKASKEYIRTFAKKGSADAADVSLALTAIYERQDDLDKLVAHLRSYVKEYAKAGTDRVVLAYAKIGEALWRQACPIKTVDGACVQIERANTARTCKLNDAPRISVHTRDEALGKDAQQALKMAVSIYEKAGGKTGGDDALARFYYARAKFLLAEPAFEAYLDLRFPTGLDFDPNQPKVAKKSLKRFGDWMAEKQKLGAAATEQYQALFAVRDPVHAISAAARLGQIPQHYAQQLYGATIPESKGTKEERATAATAYCDTLAEHAEPIEAQALVAFEACYQASIDFTYWDEYSALCERELGQIDPAKYPRASELRAAPVGPGGLDSLEDAIATFPE